ncbi:MAG: hypothetical protein GY754_17435 [bacterium]|nr:hypothetical protein [bacterium]
MRKKNKNNSLKFFPFFFVFLMLAAGGFITGCDDAVPESIGAESGDLSLSASVLENNKCVTVKSETSNGYLVAKYWFGYKYHASGSYNERAKFFLKPTGFGTYILYDQNADMLVADGGKNTGRWHHVSDKAEWRLKSLGGSRFAIQSVKEGRWLSTWHQGWPFYKWHTEVVSDYNTRGTWVIEAASGCTAFPESEVNAQVTVTQKSPNSSVWGFADIHTHIFSNEGFGGLLFQGKPFHKLGITKALADCTGAHGVNGILDNIANIADGRFTHDTRGYPHLTGWPIRDSSDHQTMYYKWIKRAWLGGLRLMVTHAVTNELLCQFANKADGYSCDDMEAVDRQLAQVKEMEKYIDAQNGGPGKGWFRIVYSPEEARTVINSGKLAVILGIEVDSIFGCTPDECDIDTLSEQLDVYYDKGVRSIFPLHLWDNGLGGASMQLPTLQNLGNKIVTGNYLDLYDCSAQGYEYQEPLTLSEPLQALFGSFLPVHEAADAHCNSRGLTDAGDFFIRELIKRNMIIEIDHMNSKTINRALEIAEEYDYPVVAAHTGLNDIQHGSANHEGQKTKAHMDRIRDLGGIVAPILMQGEPHTFACSGSIEQNCKESSKGWAQAYLYVVEQMGPNAAVPMGTDFNGFIHMPAARFGDKACVDNKEQAALQTNPVVYPFSSHGEAGTFQKQRTGERVWDINYDGLAHYGLLPDFIQDLKNIGMTDQQLEPLFKSAEGYISMWEKAHNR